MSDRLIEQLREATRAQSRLRPVEPRASPPGGGKGDGGGPFGWISLLFIVALVVVGWFVIRQIQADSKLQDCLMSGRKNCAPIDTSTR